MTWSEIKRAAEAAGVGDDETIVAIACEDGEGDKTLHRVAIGSTVRLVEGVTPEPETPAFGCAS